MTLTNDQIREWQALANKATPGPWQVFGSARRRILSVFAKVCDDVIGWTGFDMGPASKSWQQREADAAFIAASREAVPALCADVLALRADNERLNGIITSAVPTDYLPIDTPHEFVAAVEVQRLRAEVARLREALGPFAEAPGKYEPHGNHVSVLVLLDDLRRARTVMEGGK